MRFLPMFAIVLMGCGGSEITQVSALRLGAMTYHATSLDGEPLLSGTLAMQFVDTVIGGGPCTLVRGTWDIGWATGADTTIAVGPQVGAGSLEGLRSGDTLWLNLNPGWADNNALLLGELTSRGLTGHWQWSTIAGPRTEGRFTAIP